MRKRDPRHRYLEFKNKEQLPETASERTIYVLMHGAEDFNKALPHNPWPKDQVVEPTAYYAWEIFHNDGLKNLFEAFLFATEDNDLVNASLGVAQNDIALYRDLFFTTSVFYNDLERIAWLQTVPDDDPAKELFKMAFHQGYAALRWTYCRNKGQITMEEAEDTVLTDSYVQYLQHRGKPLNGKVAKEARSLSRVILDAVRTKRSKDEVGGAAEGSENLRFKFNKARPTTTIEELNSKGIEVIH